MSRAVGRALVVIACVTLLHAAFSTYEYLSIMKAVRGRGTSAKLPISIIIEALLALALFLPGTALSVAPLKDVTYRGELARRTMDDIDARMPFMRISPRGRAFFGTPLSKQI